MPNDTAIKVRVATEELEKWKQSAKQCGETLSEWIRGRCSSANGDSQSVRPARSLRVGRRRPSVSTGIAPAPRAETEAHPTCGHPLEPGHPGKCQKWGCKFYAFAR